MRKISLLMLLPLLAFAVDANEGGHGGDTLIDRVLMARVLAKRVVERAAATDLTKAQRETMLKVLERQPRFAKSVTTADERGVQVEVSARYDDETGEVTFNLTRCRDQDLSFAEMVALWLHEAGHPAGLSHSMSGMRQEFLSDIGYRLVLKELDRPDSILREPSLQPAPPPPNAVAPGNYCGKMNDISNFCVLHDKSGPISIRPYDNVPGSRNDNIEVEWAGVTNGLVHYQSINPVTTGDGDQVDFRLQEEKGSSAGTIIAHFYVRPSFVKYGVSYLWTENTAAEGAVLTITSGW